jgi:ABC-type anion transport system duplicated permease subunit
VLGISNLHISTIFLLNAGTVSAVCYIFFHFITGYENKTAELQLLKNKYGCDRLEQEKMYT